MKSKSKAVKRPPRLAGDKNPKHAKINMTNVINNN